MPSLLVFLLLVAPVPLLTHAGCRFPGAPAHCSVLFSNSSLGPATVATYVCQRGFELLGPSRRVCGTDLQWTPEGIPFCVLNVAAGKAPMQVSSEPGGVPQKAIDGSSSAFFNPETCTLTRPEPSPWWYVNLLEPYMVQLVRLDFGKPCCGKNRPATIVVRVGNNRPDLATNPVCNRFTGYLHEGKPLFLPCNPPMPGAFVSVHLESASPPNQLSICEAFVYTDQALPIERCPQFRDQPPGSTATYNGKCYIFYNRQPLNFREALALCRARGGSLVDESNPALQGFISWELWRRHRTESNSQYWMGVVRDQADRSNWKWISGEEVAVSFWNLPAGGEDCARYDGAKGWLWSDTKCSAKINYICQHQAKACGRPEQPPNSSMIADNFEVGSSVEYSCDEGHLLVGPASRLCLPTGFYNEFPPVCKRISCGLPADILYGGYELVDGTVGYKSKVVYSCDEGYKMVGRAQLTCDLDERWDGPPPRCHQEEGVERAPSEETVSRPAVTVSGPAVTPSRPAVTVSGPAVTASTRPTSTRHQPRPFSPNPVTKATTPLPHLTDNRLSESARVPQVVVASGGSYEKGAHNMHNVRSDLINAGGLPAQDRTTLGAKLNLGAIIALGVFGGFVFLAAVVTTIVILIKRNRSGKHYRHRASPDCNTVASLDSSGSESRGGLNRYYRQAWESLQEATKAKECGAAGGGGGGSGVGNGGGGGGGRDKQEERPRRHHHHHRHGQQHWPHSHSRY